jgi:hypothetical protein
LINTYAGISCNGSLLALLLLLLLLQKGCRQLCLHWV